MSSGPTGVLKQAHDDVGLRSPNVQPGAATSSCLHLQTSNRVDLQSCHSQQSKLKIFKNFLRTVALPRISLQQLQQCVMQMRLRHNTTC